MVIKRMRAACTAVVMFGLLVCTSPLARAQEGAATNQELVEAIKALQSEVSSLKAEVEKVRGEQQTIQRELAALKKVAAKPPARQQRKVDTTVYEIPIGNSPVLGSKDAPVTIVEFSDLQCPYCIKEYPKLQQVLKDYPNDVKVVFKHFPLSFHKKAPAAHAATVLAGKQGEETFWKMHDLIVQNPRNLDVPDLRKHAETLGLDLQEFDIVMADPARIDELFKADMAQARKCNVSGTPSVFINGLKLANRNPEGYKARIDELLKKKDAAGG